MKLKHDFLDTAFIASKGGWLYCDDSSVKPTDPKSVVVCRLYFLANDCLTNYTTVSRIKRPMSSSISESGTRIRLVTFSYSIFNL